MSRAVDFKQDLRSQEQVQSARRRALRRRCAPGAGAHYNTRPALANERVQCDTAGQPVLMLKTLRRDGNVHLVMSPPAFMRLRVGLPLCGKGIHWRYVSSGSTTANPSG